MLLNIIFILIVVYLSYNLIVKKELFTPNQIFVQNNYTTPICNTITGNCLDDFFSKNNINIILSYTDDNNFKAKQNNNSLLKPKYLF